MQNFLFKKFEFGIQKIPNGCLKYWHVSNFVVVIV